MNKLPLAKRAQILTLLCEGSSMRSIERIIGCSINTVDKLLRDAGEVALAYHDEQVRGVKAIGCNATRFGASSRSNRRIALRASGQPTRRQAIAGRGRRLRLRANCSSAI